MAQRININGLNFKQTRKKKYDVYMCMPKIGTQVYNKLEGSHYVTDNNKRFVLSGTVGEQWVIDANKLAKTYILADGREITPDTLRSCMGASGTIDWVRLTTKQAGMGINFAAHIPLSVTNYPVQTSWGDVLYANKVGVPNGKGDFIVCTSINGQPNLNDAWVVNGEIFPSTYDMRAFPGLGSAVNRELPRPKSLIGDKQFNKEERMVQMVVQGLRQRGHRVGKQSARGDNYIFTIDNGLYGVVLYINTENPDEVSNSISVMFHSGGVWTKAAIWPIDEYGLEGSIEKIHEIVSGGARVDNMVNKVGKTLPREDEDNLFGGYSSSMEKPKYFRQLLKTYNYVKDKLQLYGEQLTETGEEPVHWRIDFNTRMGKGLILFIDIDPETITACVQAENSDEQYEESFATGADGCKQTFQWMARVMRQLANQGY